MKCNELKKLTNDFKGIKWLNLRSSEAKMPQKQKYTKKKYMI